MVSIVAQIVIASAAYFSTKLSFGERMVVVGAFYQVNYRRAVIRQRS